MVSHALYAAESAMRNGNHALALDHYRRALAEAPDSALVHASISLCLSAMNRRYGAMEEALEALRLDPGLAIAKIAYGYASMLAHDDRTAERTVEEVLKENPYDIDALWLRCVIAQAARKPAALETAARELLQADAENGGALAFLSRAASLRGDGAAAEAFALDALAANPEDAAAHEALGWAYLEQGRAKRARETALMALKLAPDGPALVLLAAATVRARPLTGWLFWPGLQLLRQSDAATLVFVMTLLVAATIARNFIYYFERTDLLPVLDAVYWGVILIIVLFNVTVRFMLDRDVDRVRMRAGF